MRGPQGPDPRAGTDAAPPAAPTPSPLPLTVLKLGGSVITNKDDNRFEVRTTALARLAAEIATARRDTPQRLLLVHGAGPFGHTMVTRYNIARGLTPPRGVEGFVRTHHAVQELNQAVLDAFRDAGLLGFPVQPSAVIQQQNRRITAFDLDLIRGLLQLDPEVIPILYGDMVLDHTLGASVVSGDAIVAHLAAALGATRVALGTDVDGIFAGDPKLDPAAQRFERVDRDNFDQVRRAVRGATTVDVTGGMEQKLLEIRARLAGIEVAIFNANRPGHVELALRGERVGTQICF